MRNERRNRLSILALILMSVFLLTMTACTKRDIMEELCGVYYPVSCTSDEGEVFEIEDEELHIEADGKGYFLFSGNKYELKWKYEDGVFYFEDSSEDTFTGTYENKIISGKYFNDYHYVFKKK